MENTHTMKNEKDVTSFERKWQNVTRDVIWKFVFIHALWHTIAIYGFLTFPYLTHKLTFSWMMIYYLYVAFGITGGVHRFWTHRSYKANLPLRLFLAGGYYSSGIFGIYDWVKIHRVHHKYTDTDADPHNVNRGFYFAHIGWWMKKKNPEYYKRLKEIDMSDIKADAIVTFGDKHFYTLTILLAFILPTLVPIFLWNENWYYAIMSQVFMRFVMILNATGLVNSAAHMFGSKPFNRNIVPCDNPFVSIISVGEGWHNYHHVFPFDYRTGGIGKYDFNFTTFWIDQFKKIGWASDLKTASDELIVATIKKRGDGSFTDIWKEVPQPK